MVNKSQQFSNFSEIDLFFKNYNNSAGFVDWFNTNVSIDKNWFNNSLQPITITNQLNWQKTWSNIQILFGKSTINLIEFLSINSIIVNETYGKFSSFTEYVGMDGYPGISYAFDSITNVKQSYNILSTNKTAYALFNDPVYIKVHGHKPFGAILQNTTDTRWNTSTFPLGFYGSIEDETNTSGKTNTFITEADFMKFRSRGYVHTIGRNNYKPIIQFILNYNGDNSIILKYKNSWEIYGVNLDSIASASTNDDWEQLFNNTNSIIPNYAFYLNSILPGKYKNYNIIDPNQSDVNLNKSIRNIALAIAGDTAISYANNFLQRVLIQIDILNQQKQPSTILSNILVETSPISPTPGILERTGIDPNAQVNSGNSKAKLNTITNIFPPTAKPDPIKFYLQ